jgi:hypothetical protein
VLCPQKLFKVVADLFFFVLLPDGETFGGSEDLNVLLSPSSISSKVEKLGIIIAMLYVYQS